MNKLMSVWTQHLPDDQKEDFEKYVRNSSLLIDRLVDILQAKGVMTSVRDYSEGDFEDPNWAYKQAFRNGQKAALKDVLKLFKFRTDPSSTKGFTND